MLTKNHRKNTNFQIAYFLAGGCHTPDGAYGMLCELKEEREMAIDNYKVEKLKQESRKLLAEEIIDKSSVSHEIKLAEADLLEINNLDVQGNILYQAALDELKFIDECIAKIRPHRKYAHLADPEAHEACQQEEWKLELMHRAENYLATTGSIPADHFTTMRQHPEFESAIKPRIEEIYGLLRAQKPFEMVESKVLRLLQDSKGN